MSADPIATLVEHGEEHGCVHMTELHEIVQKLELEEDDVESLLERLEAHGIELTDDCSRAIEEEVTLHEHAGRVGDDRLAAAVPQRGRALPAADRRAGGRAREADRARRQGGEGPARQLEPAARRVDREEVPGARPDAARPDPGRDHRADPRRREVRLAQGLQVLDLRDVVDPAGSAARSREQGAHDPHPRPHRRARAEDRRAPSASWSRRSSARRPTRRWPSRRSCR